MSCLQMLADVSCHSTTQQEPPGPPRDGRKSSELAQPGPPPAPVEGNLGQVSAIIPSGLIPLPTQGGQVAASSTGVSDAQSLPRDITVAMEPKQGRPMSSRYKPAKPLEPTPFLHLCLPSPQPPGSLIFFFNLKKAHSFPLVPGGMILVLFPNTTHAYCGELLWPPPSGKHTTLLFSGSEPCLSCVSRGTRGSKGPAEPRTLDILCSHYNLITTCTWSGPRQMLSLACPAHLVPPRPPPQVPAVSLKDWHYHVPNPY